MKNSDDPAVDSEANDAHNLCRQTDNRRDEWGKDRTKGIKYYERMALRKLIIDIERKRYDWINEK